MDHLPSEIIVNIAESIERKHDLNHLLQTAPRYAHLLTHNLYNRDISSHIIGHTPILHWAIQKGHISVVKRLLQYGCNPRSNMNGITALATAAQGGKYDIAQVLLDAGAGTDINIPNDGKSPLLTMPLIVACRQGHHDIVNLLLARGADVSASYNTLSETALHVAVLGWDGDERMVRVLLDAGADTSARDWRGKAPLHHAVEGETGLEEGLVRLLLQAGTDVHARSDVGKTALGYATDNGSQETVRILLAAGAHT